MFFSGAIRITIPILKSIQNGRFILNLFYDWNIHTYVTTKEQKKKAFTINTQNKNQEIGIQLTFSRRE